MRMAGAALRQEVLPHRLLGQPAALEQPGAREALHHSQRRQQGPLGSRVGFGPGQLPGEPEAHTPATQQRH